MMFIENAWRTILGSYTLWLGQIIGWASAYQVFLQALSPADQLTLHAAGQIHWIPIVIAFLGVFGIGFARSIKQPTLGGKP